MAELGEKEEGREGAAFSDDSLIAASPLDLENGQVAVGCPNESL